MRVILGVSLLALLVVAFAGCVGGEGKSAPPATAPIQAPPPEFSEETGAIDGQVTDDEGLPITGAEVAIIGGAASTFTAADGRFTLSNVAPGKQTLAAQKLGYESASRIVEVLVGDVVTVSLTLVPLITIEEYHDGFVLDGYFDCTWYYSAVATGASGPCGYTAQYGTIGNPLEQLWTNSKRKWDYPIGPHLMTLTNEVSWVKGTAATADELRIILSHGPIDGKERNQGHNFCITGGANPVKMRWEREDAEDDGGCKTGSDNPSPGPKTISWEKGLLVESFVSVDPASIQGVASQPVALAYQQGFKLYVTYFHGAKAPEEFSALADA
jgi:hypothetical protein